MAPNKIDSQKKWFLPDDASLEPHGPFSTLEIENKIKAGELKADDYIFLDDLKELNWRRIWEYYEFASAFQRKPVCPLPQKFSRGKIAEPDVKPILTNIRGEYGEENLYRRYPRIPYDCEVIVHNQQKIIYSQSIDLCEISVSLNCDSDPQFAKGSEVFVTVRGNSQLGTFSARAVVIRAWSKGSLALYFLNLNPRQKRRIAKLVLQTLEKLSSGEKSA